MLRWLVRSRAPLDLSAMASRFSLDELAHAELCARVAGTLGGGASIPYREESLYPEAGERQCSELEAARLVLWNCCASETFSHAILAAAAAAERHPVLRQVRARIAKDEAVHARFGWIYLDWLLPDLEPEHLAWLGREVAPAVRRLRRGLDAAARLPDDHFHPLCPLGALGRDRHLAAGHQALRARVLEPLRARGIVVA